MPNHTRKVIIIALAFKIVTTTSLLVYYKYPVSNLIHVNTSDYFEVFSMVTLEIVISTQCIGVLSQSK